MILKKIVKSKTHIFIYNYPVGKFRARQRVHIINIMPYIRFSEHLSFDIVANLLLFNTNLIPKNHYLLSETKNV